MKKIKHTLILIMLVGFIGCTKNTMSESNLVKIAIVGDVYEADWLEINNYKIEFVLPDTSKAIAFNLGYNPYFLEVSKDNNKLGFISPTITYEAGPGKPIMKKVSKGTMLLNVARILNQLSYSEYDSSIFDFKTDKTAILNGLLIFGLKSGEPVKVTYPQTMNILVEPYKTKE